MNLCARIHINSLITTQYTTPQKSCIHGVNRDKIAFNQQKSAYDVLAGSDCLKIQFSWILEPDRALNYIRADAREPLVDLPIESTSLSYIG
jgi:hypothetical protein